MLHGLVFAELLCDEHLGANNVLEGADRADLFIVFLAEPPHLRLVKVADLAQSLVQSQRGLPLSLGLPLLQFVVRN